MAVATARAQIGLMDEILENEHIAAQLDRWQAAKAKLAPLQVAFRELDEKLKADIKELGLEPGEHRCGRWVISVSEHGETDVSFARKPGVSIRIKSPKQED